MNNNFVITIAREYGCGGRDIGKAIAKKLEIEYYDNDLIKLAAKQNGVDEGFYMEYDEKSSNKLTSMFTFSSPSGGFFMPMYNDLVINDKLFYTQASIIKSIGDTPCVIVGRCADYILKDKPNLIKIFLHADIETRKERIINKYGVEAKNIEKFIAKADKQRSMYYNTYTDSVWGNTKNYHLTLDTSKMSVANTAEFICKYLELINQ